MLLETPSPTGPGPWTAPPRLVRPSRDEVHVWRAPLTASPALLDERARALDEHERNRAARFRFPSARARFVAARGLLRQILAGYLDVPPYDIALRYNPFGKPELDPRFRTYDVRFNLSHAGNVAVYAIGCGREVGVDVEDVSSTIAVDDIAERFFSPAEAAGLRALPEAARRRAFFACWTRKEALAKAQGEGLTFERLLVDETADECGRWQIAPLPMGDGHEGTLAVEGRNWQMRCWAWPREQQPGRE
jgi:4'-phosphopantetheinyl transferase